jgi:hypothetical protein
MPATARVLNPAPSSLPTAGRNSRGPRPAVMPTYLAHLPPALALTGDRSSSDGGKRTYRTSDGRVVELPHDMTAEEAATLEAEAKAAEKKLGKGPPPKPVPDVRKPTQPEGKKAKTQPGAKKKKVAKGKGKAGRPPSAIPAILRQLGGSKVAQYLVGKAAPVLRKGVALLQKLRQNEQTHDDAGQKLTQAEKAVVIPSSEGQSKSNTGQVNVVSERPAPTVDAVKAKNKLQESLQENLPQTIEDADNFKRDKKAQHIGADVMKMVQGDKTAVLSTFNQIEQTPPPAPPEHAPQALPPEETAPASGNLNLGQGAVAPLAPEHTNLNNYTKEANEKLKEEGVTQEQLDLVDSGDLAEANREKKGMEKAAITEPLTVQKLVQQEGAKIDQDLRQDEKKQRDALRTNRKASLGSTAQKQKNAKSALEKKREEVASKINGIYTTTQNRVKKKLAALETDSMKRFDDGNTKASTEFEDSVRRELDTFKADRYSGFFGWARKAKDWLLGMDDLPRVKAIFDRNRTIFVRTINMLVNEITADNKRVIQECKDELVNARKAIKEYVDKLEPDLKSIGQQRANEMSAKLNELDQFVAKKEQELQDKLKEKQQAAIKAIDQKIEKMKEAMSGALAKLGKLLLWAAKKLFTWALKKFGYSLEEIEGVINKGVAVLKAIFTQPIRFVKNLVMAAKSGFQTFAKNFLKHLQDAVFDWLTGSLEGIRLPSTWDLKGIASVAFQLIGLTWTNIRGKLVPLMGETAVKAMETGFDLVVTLVREGPMAAWAKIQEMANDIKEALIQGVKDFIKIKIVEEAIKTIISLFVPGAGLIRAVVGIYDTIVFFIKKAKQIAQMVGRFLGSIGEIAMGNISAAAEALEKGLATALKLVINFLARFLRLDGVTARIRKALDKLRGKVNAMLDKVANWIADKAKKLFGKVKAGVKALVQWWKKKLPFKGGGETHTLFFQGEQHSAQLMVQTEPRKPEDFIRDFVPTGTNSKDAKEIVRLSRNIDALKKKIEVAQKQTPPDDATIATLDRQLTDEFNNLGQALANLLNKSGEEGSEKRPVPVDYPKRRAAAYPDIYVGPPTQDYLDQKWLKAAVGLKPEQAKQQLAVKEPKLKHVKWSGEVRIYRAASPSNPPIPGGPVGLAPAIAALAPGKVLKYEERGKTGGGSKINNVFRPYGFRAGKEGLDGDHVIERQLGGPDDIVNLWPLPLGENRSSGAILNSMPVTFLGERMTVHDARSMREKKKKTKALHLLIRTVK